MKRFAALVMAVLFAFSGASAFSADEYSQQMSENLQDIVLKVKQKINVPAEFKDVDYSVYDENIRIVWKNNNSESIQVGADKEGEILDYYFFSEKDSDSSKLVNVQEAENASNEFIKNILPSRYGQYKLEKTLNRTNTDEYIFYYKAYVNNIQVSFDSLNIEVNKHTGKVTSCRVNKTKTDGIYPDSNGIVSKEAAVNEYINEKGIDLYYSNKYNRDTQKYEINLVSSNKNIQIDARTGKKVIYDTDSAFASGTMADYEAPAESAAGGSANMKASLSQEEIDKAEEIAGLISPDDALKKLKDAFSLMKNEKLSGSSITRDYPSWYARNAEDAPKSYNIRISTQNSNSSLNAETGEIKSFYYRYDDDYYSSKRKRKLTYADAEKKAQEALDKLKIKTPLYNGDAENYAKESPDEYYDYYIGYYQLKDGIRYVDNNISFTISGETGDVISYRKSWEDKTFPAVNTKPEDKQLFDMIEKNNSFSLKYSIVNDEIKLIYGFEENNMEINALTGERINSYWTDADDVKSYDDISGHKCEKYIEYLSNRGCKFDGGSFEPDKELTWNDLIDFMNSNNEDTDKFLKDYEPYVKNIKNKYYNGESVTRYDMTDILCKNNEYPQKFIENPQYFADIFNDVSEEYKVKAAISVMFGFMNADSGSFEGEKIITRAEMAEILYNMFTYKN